MKTDKPYLSKAHYCKYLLLCLFLLISSTAGYTQTASKSTIDSLEAKKLFEQGQRLLDEAKYDRSLSHLTQAADFYKQEKNWSKLTVCYNLLSTNQRILSRLDQSERLAGNVLQIINERSLDLPLQQVKAYNNLGLIETERSNFKEAITHFEEALKLTDRSPVPIHIKSMLLGNIGSANDDRGDYDKALIYYTKGIELLNLRSSKEDRKQLAKLYNYSGVTHAKIGHYDEALYFYKNELQINLDIYGQSHPSVAGGYNNIGGIYYRKGDIGEAIVYFKRAASSIELTFGKNHPRVGLVYNNIGACYYEIGDYSQSIEYLKKAAEIKKETQGAYHPDLALTYNNIGGIYIEMNRHEEAIDFLNRSLKIRVKALGSNHPVLSNNYNSLGLLYLRTDRFDKAIESFRKSLAITENNRSSSHPYAAEARTNLSKAYREKGDYSSALMHLEQAENNLLRETGAGAEDSELQLIPKFKYPTYAVDVLDEKGKTLYRQYKETQPPNGVGLLKSALSTYTRLSELLDAMQVGFRNEESKLIMRSRSHGIYESAIQISYDLYEATGNKKYLNEIFYFSEKSKSRVILELLNNKKAKRYAGIPDSLLAYERNLREKISEFQQSLNSNLSSTGSESDKDSLETTLFNLHQKLNKHLERLKRDYPKYHSFKFQSEVPDPAQLKKQLSQKNVTLLEYFHGEESTWAILIDESDINVLSLPYTTNLTEKISRFNRAISQKKDTVYSNLGRQLYKTLVEPLIEFIPKQELLIIPDGPLNLMPFEALLTASVNKETPYTEYPFLLKDFAISYMPSVSLSSFFKEQQRRKYPDKFIGYAPVFSDSRMSKLPEIASRNNWSALPSTLYEVEQIAQTLEGERSLWTRLTGGNSVQIFTGKNATESRFKNGTLNKYRYLHLATHAFASDSGDGEAGIAFYPESNSRSEEDGILFSEEIYSLNLSNELIVLSACETGIGEVRTGEGIIGLSRAFQYAGAENLMVSLWNVEDRSTARLMILFYEGLQTGNDANKALQSAKKELIDNPSYAHPRYWSPFIFIGN